MRDIRFGIGRIAHLAQLVAADARMASSALQRNDEAAVRWHLEMILRQIASARMEADLAAKLLRMELAA